MFGFCRKARLIASASDSGWVIKLLVLGDDSAAPSHGVAADTVPKARRRLTSWETRVFARRWHRRTVPWHRNSAFRLEDRGSCEKAATNQSRWRVQTSCSLN